MIDAEESDFLDLTDQFEGDIHKHYQEDIESVFLCLNPHCKDPTNRLFTHESKHFNDYKCMKWVTSKSSIVNYQDEMKLQQNQQIEFCKEPIKNILKAASSRNSILTQLSKLSEKIRADVEESIRVMESIIKLKINQILTPSESFISRIREFLSGTQSQLLNEMGSFKIQEIIRVSEMEQFIEANNVVMMPSQLMSKQFLQLKHQIQCLFESMVCYKEQLEPDTVMSAYEKNCIMSYIFDEAEDHQRMIQKYTSLFKSHPKKIYEKNTKQRKYRNKCPLCEHTIDRDFCLGKDLGDNWRNLADHLYLHHFNDLCYYYSHNISKKAIKQITPSDVLHLLNNYSFENVYLLLKGGRKLFQPKNLTHKDLVLDVMHSKGQSQSNQWKYVSLPDFSEFPLFISLVSVIVSQKKEKGIVSVYGCKVNIERWRSVIARYGLNNINYFDETILQNQSQKNSVSESIINEKGDEIDGFPLNQNSSYDS